MCIPFNISNIKTGLYEGLDESTKADYDFKHPNDPRNRQDKKSCHRYN